MSYDLAVWVGPAPASDAEAAERFAALIEPLDDPPAYGPDPVIVAFAEDLLARFPDITEAAGDQSPWAVGPLKADIVGSFFLFPMSRKRPRNLQTRAKPLLLPQRKIPRAKSRGHLCPHEGR